jgi:hypothetical protein
VTVTALNSAAGAGPTNQKANTTAQIRLDRFRRPTIIAPQE